MPANQMPGLKIFVLVTQAPDNIDCTHINTLVISVSLLLLINVRAMWSFYLYSYRYFTFL